MTDDLRPAVAALLRPGHPAETGELSREDAVELRRIAAGASHPEYRITAMALLAETAPEPGVFHAALADADAEVRAAGARLLARCAAPDAEAALLAALAGETDTAARRAIVDGLVMVGGEDALPALAAVADSDGNLAARARFAASVVAHRAGLPGYDTDPAAVPRPAPDGTSPAQALESYEDTPDRPHLAGDAYGLILGPSVASLRCGTSRLALAVDLTALARLLTTPTIAALVAGADPAATMLALCAPAGDNTARVAVHRTGGTPVYAGTARVTGTTVTFQLTGIRAPATITGTLTAGVLRDLTVAAPR
jgi:hypothetical protein